MINFIHSPEIYNASHEKLYDTNMHIPKEVGVLKLLRHESHKKITYYDWDLSFNNPTFASRPDNFGKDEIQVIFNLNQKIEWKIGLRNIEQNHVASDGYGEQINFAMDSHVFSSSCETVNMIPGEVCVFRNNDYQTSMVYDESVNFKFKSLQMQTSYFEELLSKYFPKKQIELCKSVFLNHVTKTLISPEMYRVLSEIDDAEKYHEFKDLFIEAKMMELIALVLNGIFYDKVKISPRNQSERMASSDSDIAKIENLYQRIKFNPADEYVAPDLAKNLCMSESKLTRLFCSLYGTSLHQFVKNQRLEKATALLSQGGMNISEIAAKCGYNNMSHFSKEFQKKFGVLPSKIAK